MAFDKFYSTAGTKGFHWPGRMLAGDATLANWLSGIDRTGLIIIADQAFAEHDLVRAFGGAAIIVRREPHEADIRTALVVLAGATPTTMLAIGGGATLDTAKAITAHLRYGTWDIRDRPREASPLQLVAVPTTAGSGSETSRFFIVSDDASHTKRAVRSWAMVPDLTILDPSLLASASPRHVLLGALDASIHLFETHIARGEATPFTDGLAQSFVPKILKHLPAILDDGLDNEARLDLMQASAMAGICISNVRTGLIHTLGESLAAHVDLPHPMTLRVFLSAAVQSYAHAIAAHTAPLWAMADAVAPWGRPWNAPRFVYAWEEAFARLRLDDEIALAFCRSDVTLDGLCETAARDTTLCKENPLALDATALRLIAATALSRWPRREARAGAVARTAGKPAAA